MFDKLQFLAGIHPNPCVTMCANKLVAFHTPISFFLSQNSSEGSEWQKQQRGCITRGNLSSNPYFFWCILRALLACFISSNQDDAQDPSRFQPSQLPNLCQTLSGDGIDLELGSGGGALSRPRAWASRSIFKRKSGSKPFSSKQNRLGTDIAPGRSVLFFPSFQQKQEKTFGI